MMPVPSGAQLEPFHLAIFSAANVSAVENPPPANSAGPVPSSNAASAITDEFVPPPFVWFPSACQSEPSQRATLFAWLAPPFAKSKFPPAHRFPPNTARLATYPAPPASPEPTRDQVE